jgi:hypothetical protein
VGMKVSDLKAFLRRVGTSRSVARLGIVLAMQSGGERSRRGSWWGWEVLQLKMFCVGRGFRGVDMSE